MSNPEKDFGDNSLGSKYVWYRKFLPMRNRFAQFIDTPAETLEIDAQMALNSAQEFIKSPEFKHGLKAERSKFPEQIPNQEVAIGAVNLYARLLVTSSLVKLQEQKNIPLKDVYAFVQAMDIASGIMSVSIGFLTSYRMRGISLEDIKNKTRRDLNDEPEHVLDELLNELNEEHALITNDPSGHTTIDYLVSLIKKKSQENRQEPGLIALTLNPIFPTVGAEIAGIIFKASSNILNASN